MNKTVIAGMAAIIISITATVFCWETEFSDQNLRVFQGKVANVDAPRSTLVVNGPIQIEFPISPETELVKNTYSIKLYDINVGDYVTVEYYRSGSESRVPKKVIRVTVESWE